MPTNATDLLGWWRFVLQCSSKYDTVARQFINHLLEGVMAQVHSKERSVFVVSGWVALGIFVIAAAIDLANIFGFGQLRGSQPGILNFLALPLLVFLAKGFIIVQPNTAAVFTFFGSYSGSLREDGFFWVNPLYVTQRISLRAHNLTTPVLKVNDFSGNPIEVGAVVVWRVMDSCRAAFDVEDFAAYVAIQSESAVRGVASERCYDGGEDGKDSLRGDLVGVSDKLAKAIQAHVALAGVEIIEARIAHLAYAPEIASAMLRRQQAAAVVSARTQIVEGAVSMVRLAIERLESDKVVTLEAADRVRLTTNLMTVLVSDSETQPVISVDRG